MLARKNISKVGLQGVGVLIFIDEHMEKMLLQRFADAIALRDKPQPVHKQIVEIHRGEFALASLVFRSNFDNLVGRKASSLRLPARGHLFNADGLVGRFGNHLRDNILLREILRVVNGGLDNLVDQLLLVIFVQNLE